MRYDKIEKIEELTQELPEVTFHIGANTMMSDTLMNLEKRGNVKLYPGLSQNTLNELWEKCDFYLDINLYGEIRDAVNVAQQNNSTCAVRFYSHTTKLGTQIQWICSFLGHYKRNLSLSEPDILIVILIDHFDSSKGTASML